MKNQQRMQKPHIMKFVEVTALLLALLIVEIVIGVAIYRHAAEVAYNGQMDDYRHRISRLADSVDHAIENGKNRTPAFTGTLDGTGFRLSNSEKSYEADANIAGNLKDNSR